MLAALTNILSGCFGYIPGQKAYFDAQVREMCEKDGGIKIFEIVHLDKHEYSMLLDLSGRLDPPSEDHLGRLNPRAPGLARPPEAPIIHTFKTTVLRDGYPSVQRTEIAVVRRSDRKILGTKTSYSRIGGDPPGPSHPSHFSCPEEPMELYSAVVKLKK